MIKIIPRKLFDCSGWLPPGVTDAMCDGPEDAPCAACGHMGEEHPEKSVKDIADRCEPCSHKDCDCPDYMEGEWDVRRDEYDD